MTARTVGLAVLSWLFLMLPIAVAYPRASDVYGGCVPCGLSNPFAPFQFVMELASFATVFYLALAGRKQRRRIFVAAASCMYEAAVFLRGLRTGIVTVVRRQAVTTCRLISRLGRSLAVLLIALVSMLPNTSAQDPCGQCVPADPFQPFKFFLLVSAYGLVIWMFLSARTKRYSSSIYRTLMLAIDRYHMTAKTLARVIALGFLITMVVVVPVFAEGGDDGGGCCGGLTAIPNPFAAFEFFAQVIIYSVSIMVLLSPRKIRNVGARLYQAITRILDPLLLAEEESLRIS